jgi:predicted MPP superfamily phosphohydrolase
MSHDPSHWDYEIKTIKAINLTLSGHTHGMQFELKSGYLNEFAICLYTMGWFCMRI